MRLLHSSDWHLGRQLYGRRRYEEFAAFLDWLVARIEAEAVDVLLVAGDIFDSTAPSNRAQQLYYRFLCRVAASSCSHVVVVAGNHDSPTFLEAPRELLRALDVHVVGAPSADPREQVLTLRDARGEPAMIVCAVPYLRDRDLRSVAAGESTEDKERKLTEGIRDHYAAVAAQAEALRAELGPALPLVATGHLFTAGGQTVDGDGVRELYIGSLGHVGAGIFPDCFDYVALGHLHVPQRVAGREHIRYCGSPLPMGFGEARQRKVVLRVDFAGRRPQVAALEVPRFQALERLSGDLPALEAQLRERAGRGEPLWLELVYDGEDVVGDLRERLEAALGDSPLEILRLRNTRLIERVLGRMGDEETLDDLDPRQVFQRLLEARDVPPAARPALTASYAEVLGALADADPQAE